MYGYVLQDWVTIRGGTAGTAGDIIQSESSWLGFSSFQDIVFWLDVREAVISASQSITFFFETAPIKDNNLFQAMPTAGAGTVLGPAFTKGLQPLVKVVLASAPGVPLATWVRWRVSPSSGITTPWDATFRVLVATNRATGTA